MVTNKNKRVFIEMMFELVNLPGDNYLTKGTSDKTTVSINSMVSHPMLMALRGQGGHGRTCNYLSILGPHHKGPDHCAKQLRL